MHCSTPLNEIAVSTHSPAPPWQQSRGRPAGMPGLRVAGRLGGWGMWPGGRPPGLLAQVAGWPAQRLHPHHTLCWRLLQAQRIQQRLPKLQYRYQAQPHCCRCQRVAETASGRTGEGCCAGQSGNFEHCHHRCRQRYCNNMRCEARPAAAE